MSTGVDRKASTRGGGALERGHRASLERLTELGDALCGVGARNSAIFVSVEPAERVTSQAAREWTRVNGR